MQAQRLSLPTHISAPFNFPHSSHISSFLSPARYSSNLVFKANSKSGCYSSVKSVSKLSTGFRKYGGLVMASGGVAREVDGNDKDDGFYIRKCVELARKAIGRTSPNPMVGCVIVKDGKIVGEGFHPKAGQPHAEVFALRDAGDSAEDATAYVSLEPCNHYGRTPPCTEALIKAKVKKVVVGMTDPNPIVASKGLDRLRDEGINVTVGVEEELCKRLNEAYIHWMLTRKPFVTLRYSLSVNGHFLNQLGEGVTECGGYYSQLLREYDAIILYPPRTGEFSVPISKEPGAKQPLWIVTTRSPCSPVQLPPLTEEASSNLIIFTDNAEAVAPATAGKGIETVVLDRININAILEYCKQQGLCSVLLDLRESSVELEGLLNDCFEQNALQKVIVELLPIWKESSDRSSLVELKNIGRRLNHLQPKISDQSIVLEGYF